MDQELRNIKKSSKFIRNRINKKPEIGIILGSGLGSLAEEVENPIIIPYDEIPYFPTSTVKGHKGRLILGELEGKTLVFMQGRFHYYEGYPAKDITYPVRVMKELAVEKLLVTNAAGAVNSSLEPGDLMLIVDHINLSGTNPLIGENLACFGPRFPDMSDAYSEPLANLAFKTARENDIKLKKGVYAFMSGPSYETPAEVKMLRKLGADSVGMSTAPEVIVAVHSGIEVLGISCITNMAAGILDQPLNHDEVVETSEKVEKKFIKLIRKILANIK